MQTARRLFRTEDQDMVTRMNTVQETSEDKGVRVKRLSPCNSATQMPGNSICLCFHSFTNSFCKPNVIQHWLYTRYGRLEGTKSGKDAIATTRLQEKSSRRILPARVWKVPDLVPQPKWQRWSRSDSSGEQVEALSMCGKVLGHGAHQPLS